MCAIPIGIPCTKIELKIKRLTFHALTFGNGASINFTAPSDGFAVGFPALADAFESSVDVFAFSVLDEFALLEALLSPGDIQMKNTHTHARTNRPSN